MANTLERLVNLQEEIAANFNKFVKGTTDSQEEKKQKGKTNCYKR